MNLKKRKYFVGVTFIIFLISVFTFSLGKYTSDTVWDYYINTKEFYFTSDYLNKEGLLNNIKNWTGNEVYFNLKNSLNNQTITKYDINYEVTCQVLNGLDNKLDCFLNNENESEYQGTLSYDQRCINNIDETDVSGFNKTDCELNGYQWEVIATTKNMFFQILKKDSSYEIDEVDVLITAKSLNPYKKKIKGTFKLKKISKENLEPALSLVKYDLENILTITNPKNKERCLILSWDSTKALIDEGEYLVEGTDNDGFINRISFNLGANSSKSVVFYQNNFNKIIDESIFILSDCQ